MAMAIAAGVNISIRETATEGGGSAQDKYAANVTTTFLDAAGALGAPNQWNDQRTNGTTTESLDLAGGVTNRFGVVKTFTKVKGLWIWHRGASGTLTIGGGATPFVGHGTGTTILRPGGMSLYLDVSATGAVVAAGTGDLLQVVGSASILYEIAIWGE